jgi:hypothetical protein
LLQGIVRSAASRTDHGQCSDGAPPPQRTQGPFEFGVFEVVRIGSVIGV